MQPNTALAADLRNNGAGLPSADPAEGAVNGDANTELHNLLTALQAMRIGDFSVRMQGSQSPVLAKIADTFN